MTPSVENRWIALMCSPTWFKPVGSDEWQPVDSLTVNYNPATNCYVITEIPTPEEER